MHVTIIDDTVVIDIRQNDEQSTVREIIKKESARGFRINCFDDAQYRSLIFSIWKTPSGYGVRRGTLLGRFRSIDAAADDAVQALDIHFGRIDWPVRHKHRARA